jgi:hypothetical protein
VNNGARKEARGEHRRTPANKPRRIPYALPITCYERPKPLLSWLGTFHYCTLPSFCSNHVATGFTHLNLYTTLQFITRNSPTYMYAEMHLNALGGTGAQLSVIHVRLSSSPVFAKLDVRKETRNIHRRKVTPMNGISARQTLARGHLDLWWLLGTSVRESDGCALDCFMFLGSVAFTDQRIQEYFSCLPVLCRADAVHLLIRLKLTGRKVLPSTTRTR